jgi:SAM-dependent methyltransferase
MPRSKVALLWEALWRETFHRAHYYPDNYDDLEHLFRWSQDPWHFESCAYEQERLRSLFEKVLQYPHASILEIGCAEGVFSSQLVQIADDVVGIDVSPTALMRARQRCKSATFIHSSLEEFRCDRKFDLVICAETLYYVKDVAQAIKRLSSLGTHCLVSYTMRAAKKLDAYFVNMPSSRFQTFQRRSWIWSRGARIVVWRNRPQLSPAAPEDTDALRPAGADLMDARIVAAVPGAAL